MMMLSKFINSSVHRYMLFWVSVVVATILIGIAYTTIAYNKSAYEKELAHEVDSLTMISAQSLGSALWQFNHKYVSDYSLALFSNRKVSFVRVDEPDGTNILALTRDDGGVVQTSIIPPDGPFYSTKDVVFNGRVVGRISILLADAHMWREAFFGSLVAIVSLIVTLAILILAFYLLFRQRVYRQLVLLENGAFQAAAGDFDHPIEIDSQDEIGRVAKSFNEMLANLKLVTASRDELNDEIEVRRQAERDLGESKRLLEAILEGIGAAVFYVNPTSLRIIEVNQVALDMLQLSADQVVGHSCHGLICLLGRTCDDTVCSRYMEKSLHIEGLLERGDGSAINVVKHVLPAEFKGQQFHVEMIFDVSEQKEIMKQLEDSRKLEAVGLLAAGVAHEINTPIQYITENIKYTLSELEASTLAIGLFNKVLDSRGEDGVLHPGMADVKDAFDNIDVNDVRSALVESLEGSNRIAEIVRAMKIYAHPSADLQVATEVNPAVENAVIVTKNEWKHVARVELLLEDSLPLCWCSQSDIPQIVINLLINSIHAVADMNFETTDAGVIRVKTSLVDGNIRITVEDNGIGIDSDKIDRIYEPFYTTKEVGRGTGQGLSIVMSLVRKNGGSIYCSSAHGGGTVFDVDLPIAEAD